MANLPESAVYDAGVYQLETTDPVQGGASGVSNAPLKNLANRTTYLKQRVDNIESGATDLPGYAKSASPSFTGAPTAPTAALGDNDTSIATTAFVQATLGGRLSKSVAGSGSITLTAVEAGSGILELTGALTGNRTVILPVTPTRSWIIKNATSGAFTLTVKTAAGTGVVVTQGTNAIVWTDGTNVYDALTDFDSPVLTGNPTAPTPAQFDNGTSLATTGFVQRALGNLGSALSVSSATVLTAADAGKCIRAGGGGYTITLPLAAGLPNGACFWIQSTGTSPISVQRSGSDVIDAGENNLSTISLGLGEDVLIVRIEDAAYAILSGLGNMKNAASFKASFASSGYQRLPGGLIFQWGSFSLTSAAAGTVYTRSITFPVSFAAACIHFSSSAMTNSPNYINTSVGMGSTSGGDVFLHTQQPFSSIPVYWFAIGY